MTKKCKSFLSMIPIWVLFCAIVIIHELWVSAQNKSIFNEVCEKYNSTTILYYNDYMIRYKGKNYDSFKSYFNLNSLVKLELISPDYIIYSTHEHDVYTLYVKSISTEKQVFSSKNFASKYLLVDNLLYFESKNEYYCYNIEDDNIETILCETYLNAQNLKDYNGRYIFKIDYMVLNIEDRQNSTSKRITIEDLCNNPLINDLNKEKKKELFGLLEFDYAFENENSIYIIIRNSPWEDKIVIKYDYDTGEFEVYDAFKFDVEIRFKAFYCGEERIPVLDELFNRTQ